MSQGKCVPGAYMYVGRAFALPYLLSGPILQVEHTRAIDKMC